MTTSIARLLALGALAVTTVSGQQPAPAPAPERTLFVNEQQTLTPGYAIGNIAIGDAGIADYKVLPGRRELLLFGRSAGTTTLIIWDQRNVKRDEITMVVTTRAAVQLESDLRAMLKDYPTVELRKLGATITIAGTVGSREDQAAIEKIAQAAKVQSLVRVAAPTPVYQAPPAGATGASGGSGAAPGPVASPSAPIVDYEVELFEASSQFRTGSYATGVEPSGRSLFKGTVQAPAGGENRIFIGGSAARGRNADEREASGIRLILRPSMPDPRGRFETFVLIETNLPFSGETFDPETWRRARWQFTSASGEPFAVTGADLLATPDAAPGGGGPSRLGSAARTGAQTAAQRARVPGAEAVPILGSLFRSSSYKQKKTQLLVVLRPRVLAPGAPR
jgi:hypothetical protein